MQTITMFLRADSINAKTVDSFNQTISSLPAITRGMRVMLVLKLLDTDGNPITNLTGYKSWDFVLANDWNTGSPPQIHVTEGITATGNEIHIPLQETNTEELITALGNQAAMNIGAELAGFDAGQTDPGFLIQFDMQIRNRRGDSGTGTPVPVTDGNYSAPQIDAFLSAGFTVEYSEDCTEWSSEDAMFQRALFFRFRNAMMPHSEWSPPVKLPLGPRGFRSTIAVGQVATGLPGSAVQIVNVGNEHDAILNIRIPQGAKGEKGNIGDTGSRGEKGDNSYLYVAYAEQSDGRGFSLIPTNALKYRAEIISRTAIAHPVWNDFSLAHWVRYIGNDATVYGDVLVADQSTSVAQVNRIVFANAVIRKGVDGEVIVNFKPAGISNCELNDYSIINGRTRLSPWLNGGGSAFGNLGCDLMILPPLPAPPFFEPYSVLIGEI